MGAYKDLTGQTFGRLTAVRRIDKDGRAYYICQCSCGNVREVFHSNLTQGYSKSCGCLAKEKAANRQRTHGMTGTRIHGVWRAMKDRCARKACKAYKNYGGRGITICKEWLGKNGFQNFYDWAMNNGYRDDLTLDRIDVNGNYCPENCRWATPKEQANNTRINRFITYDGKTMTMSQWADYLGVRYSVISQRKRRGYSDIECIEGRKKK